MMPACLDHLIFNHLVWIFQLLFLFVVVLLFLGLLEDFSIHVCQEQRRVCVPLLENPLILYSSDSKGTSANERGWLVECLVECPAINDCVYFAEVLCIDVCTPYIIVSGGEAKYEELMQV